MERIIIFVIGISLIAMGGLAGAMRLWSPSPEAWHQDPATASDPRQAGVRLTGPNAISLPISETDLAQIVHVHAATWSSSERMSDEGGFTTYLTRTGVFRFPDTFSFRVISIDDTTSQLEILARTRFGGYDWGLNRARVDRLVEEIEKTIRE